MLTLSLLESEAAHDRQRRVFLEALRLRGGAFAQPKARALGGDDVARMGARFTQADWRPLGVDCYFHVRLDPSAWYEVQRYSDRG